MRLYEVVNSTCIFHLYVAKSSYPSLDCTFRKGLLHGMCMVKCKLFWWHDDITKNKWVERSFDFREDFVILCKITV